MSVPIRVAHVVGTAGASGAESHLLALLPAFNRTQVVPTLFVPRQDVLVERMRSCGIAVEYGAPRRKLALGEAVSLSQQWSGRFDLVHAHGARAAFWAVHAARLARMPAVISVHELRWLTYPPSLRRALWLMLERWTLRRAGRLIAVSETARGELAARWPELEHLTTVVHGSAPLLLAADSILQACPSREEGLLRLVTVGSLIWVKGYDILFPALAELSRRGVPWTLDIIGHGSFEARLRAQADRLGIGNRLRWLGRDAALADVLPHAHAFVTATRSEMFGIAVLEAMAYGLPVLAPAVGSLCEVVADGQSGCLVPSDPVATLPTRLADVLTTWAAHPEERGRLGARGAIRARAEFSPSALAAGVTAVYRDVLGVRR